MSLLTLSLVLVPGSVTLKNGEKLDGLRVEESPAEVVLHVEKGTITLPRREVASVDAGAPAPAARPDRVTHKRGGFVEGVVTAQEKDVVRVRVRGGTAELDPAVVASVATAFPSGQSPTEIKVAETRAVVELGADEVDMVIDRGAFLSGRYSRVYDEIVRVKEACGEAHLKVILETGELGTYDNVRRASILAMAAGADFIKTSTGKVTPAATLPVTLVMLEAIRDVYDETGRKIGMKPAGGIRQSKQAVQYLVQLYETLGADWLTPDLYRIGASTLLNDVLMQIRKERTGRYQSPDYFTVD